MMLSVFISRGREKGCGLLELSDDLLKVRGFCCARRGGKDK